jgi:hypothetical protein
MFSLTQTTISATKTSLAFHVYRDSNGAPVLNDVTRGQFVLVTVPPAPNFAPYPTVYQSRPVSAASPPSSSTVLFSVSKFWQQVQLASTNLSLFEDESISALKGSMVLHWDGNTNDSLLFLPYADGTPDIQLKDGSDFRVMERGLCYVLKQRNATFCGSANQWGY